MAYTVPTTQTDGNVIGASDWNTDLVDNIVFLAGMPAANAYRSSSQSIPDVTETIVLFNAERYDTASLHSTSATTGRMTASVDGIWHVDTNVVFASNATNTRTSRILKNGATEMIKDARSGLGSDHALSHSIDLELSAGEYVEVAVSQNSGGSLNVIAGSFMNMRLVAVT